jgi:DNA anti-recombination protein RmuC
MKELNLLPALRPIGMGRWTAAFLSLGVALALITGCDRRPQDAAQQPPAETQPSTNSRIAQPADTSTEELRVRLERQAEKLRAQLQSLRDNASASGDAMVEATRKQLEEVNEAIARLDSATAEQRERIGEEVRKLVADVEDWWKSL